MSEWVIVYLPKTCLLVLDHLSQKVFACINFVIMQL